MVKISIKLKPEDVEQIKQQQQPTESQSSSYPGDVDFGSSDDEKAEPQKFIDSYALHTFTGHTFPYDIRELSWDRYHRTNKQNVYCYCGKPQTRDSVMLQCNYCRQLFHFECLKMKPDPPPLPGDWAYNFRCCICSKGGPEHYEPLGKNWTDIVRVALWNLIVLEKRKGSDKRYFQYKEDICAYIDDNWEQLCWGKQRTKTWENTIGSALSTKANYFQSGADTLGQSGYWCLKDEIDPLITRESGSSKVVLPKKAEKRKSTGGKEGGGSVKKKKKTAEVPVEPIQKKKPLPVPQPTAKFFYNPFIYEYNEMCLAKENSAPQIKITGKYLASNEKGYRSVRSSFGVSEGAWFYEIIIPQHGGNTRLGWSTEKGDVQTPVGYDKYSYSYRDKEGTKFHQARGAPYGQPYGPGDIIGFYINLPKNDDLSGDPKDELPHTGSEMRFYKNGEDLGVAFTDIYEGTYYPAAALYMGGTVQFNFGPHFKYSPKDLDYKPICDVVPIAIAKENARRSAENTGAAPIQMPGATPSQVASPAPSASAPSTHNAPLEVRSEANTTQSAPAAQDAKIEDRKASVPPTNEPVQFAAAPRDSASEPISATEAVEAATFANSTTPTEIREVPSDSSTTSSATYATDRVPDADTSNGQAAPMEVEENKAATEMTTSAESAATTS